MPRLPLLALLLAGCGGTPAPPGDGAQFATRFLDQIRAGQLDAAYAATDANFKSYTGRDEFRKLVKKNPALAKPIAPAESAPPNYAFKPADGNATIRVGLGYEENAWKVTSLKIDGK